MLPLRPMLLVHCLRRLELVAFIMYRYKVSETDARKQMAIYGADAVQREKSINNLRLSIIPS